MLWDKNESISPRVYTVYTVRRIDNIIHRHRKRFMMMLTRYTNTDLFQLNTDLQWVSFMMTPVLSPISLDVSLYPFSAWASWFIEKQTCISVKSHQRNYWDLLRIIDTNEIIEIWKMRDKKNETADIFKTVVEIYQSNFDLYRSCRSNKVGFLIKIVIRFNT